jgi:hypothetical protein
VQNFAKRSNFSYTSITEDKVYLGSQNNILRVFFKPSSGTLSQMIGKPNNLNLLEKL